MNNKCKKICSGILATVLVGSAIGLVGCKGGVYTQDALEGYTTPTTAAVENGGFAVEYGEYVYFINGVENYTASNEFGDATKGALMRIKKSDLDKELTAENYNGAEVVVPMLFVSQNFNSGIYLYGDYVYYATPTTDKNMSGEVENSWIDFKRAKLDGSETMKDYYFRLSNNASTYRFVEENDVVYCLYEEDGALKSFNTATESTTVLVSGAKSSFFYDNNDLTNGNVYYTMAVAPDAEAPNPPSAASYDQLYCVNAAASVESVSTSDGYVSYKVKNGATYKFNQAYMEAKNDEAEDDDDDTTEAPYDFDDYTTFPYVNLGSLVLDGIGTTDEKTQFNEAKTATPATFNGYNYTVTSVGNGGVYFTRTEVMKTSTSAENTKLYYLADVAGEWNAVEANKATADGGKVETVALDTTNTASALLYKEADGSHAYLYISGTNLYRVNGLNEPVRLTSELADGSTLWRLKGDYAYYYATASSGSGNALARINYKGTADKYDNLLGLEEDDYKQETIDFVAFNSSWYKPEIIGDTLLYSNAKAFGSGSAYNYIYAAKLTNIEAQNEAYNEVQDYIDEYSVNADLQSLMKYYFATGETAAFEAVEDLYDSYQKDEFKIFREKNFKQESAFTALVGAMTEEDQGAIDGAWVDYLRKKATAETEEEGLPTWAIVLIVVGGVLVVAAAVLVPVLVIGKKKKAQRKEAEETVNAYKRKKIDTTDDKSIDVYEDEAAEEASAEASEEAAEETVTEEEAEEAEEAIEKAVEEVPAEATAETEEAVETEAEEAEKKDE